MQKLKSRLRQELIEKRRNITDRAAKDETIFKKLIALPEFAKAELILTYVSVGSEPDTRQLINYCFKENIPIAIPGIVNEKMQFFRLNSDFTLEFSLFPIHYSLLTMCVVPGLAFNKSNFRLGYGGGYYDRFLEEYSGVKIGLCYKELITDIPTESHDKCVDKVITD